MSSSKPFTLTQHHGNNYRQHPLISPFRLRRDTQYCLTSAHTNRRLSDDMDNPARVFLIAFVRIIAQNGLFVNPFLKKFFCGTRLEQKTDADCFRLRLFIR